MKTAKELFEQTAKDLATGKVFSPIEIPDDEYPDALNGVPLLYRKARLTDSKKELKPNESVYFWSAEPGTGKTHLAWAYYIDTLLNKPKDKPIFSTFGALQLRLRASMDKSQESEEEIINLFSSRKLVVLDDLGGLRIGSASDYSTSMVFEILNNRYSWKRQTIITSNKSLSEISDSFDARIASRLNAMCRVMELEGEDRRILNGE